MRVKFYGRLADLFGAEQEVAIANGCTVEDIRQSIARQQPHGGQAVLDPKIRACIGDSIVADARVVAPGECVEFFPPVSGG